MNRDQTLDLNHEAGRHVALGYEAALAYLSGLSSARLAALCRFRRRRCWGAGREVMIAALLGGYFPTHAGPHPGGTA